MKILNYNIKTVLDNLTKDNITESPNVQKNWHTLHEAQYVAIEEYLDSEWEVSLTDVQAIKDAGFELEDFGYEYTNYDSNHNTIFYSRINDDDTQGGFVVTTTVEEALTVLKQLNKNSK